MLDRIIDISHHNGSQLDFQTAAQNGILGIIHKASQGVSYVDPTFSANRTSIARASSPILFGSYHFGDGSDGSMQARHYLSVATPQTNELIALDFEGNTAGSSMTLEEARAFAIYIRIHLNKWPVLYGGHYLKEQLQGSIDTVLQNCPLWIAQYGAVAVTPPGWNKWSLWQFTDGMVNNPPIMPGIGHCDQNRFDGDEAGLHTFWMSVSPL
jgi:lysozyme